MLHGNKVENTLIGGPAFGNIMKGDILVKVDGNPVTEDNILSELRGNDTPGTEVVLTVRRVRPEAASPLKIPTERSPFASPDLSVDDEDLQEIDISITRMATAEIADRRKMFDHFSFLQVIYFFNFDSTTLNTNCCYFRNAPLHMEITNLP
jgi:C-terminal processing protease CtpA/Prc